ncbi:murein hydrolase activator EnvC family protein [Marivita hallyeonensis]|uniref:Septal ring factor EnvC, activator of murein hydrolases AmiA and AmiB n=1 Tax=Marivita hallyeonensis TaxID=996342 RepID=A0A1M5URD1_9RHOB|nr:peptidase M23 [Marivita hallyeonensis]SHH65474.1 Septal ring factor EnvC, activator of murein hydrolases AmiA and AmiB [Marivita hallyeonensis]
MIRSALATCLCLALVGPAVAQSPADAARAAMAQLEEATQKLDDAESARDRVRALTEAVQAFETGLAAMRDGLRVASIRETELRRDLDARDAEVTRLLAALSALGASASPQSFVHPDGPVGAARAGLLMASVTPALSEAAADLRADVEEATVLRQLQQDAADTLRLGLSGVQSARTALSQAMADRTDLPRKFTEDPVRTALLIAASETLDGFASGLTQISEGETEIDLPEIRDRKGALPLPVAGEVLRRAGETDAAGITRPGVLIATRPRALVTTPAAATIRYRGPLLDYGLVTILEPEPDILFVFAGLETVFGETGQVLPEGSPVGLMGGPEGEPDDILSPSGERTGAALSETLYIEVRQGETPEDPLGWFADDKGMTE